MAGFDVYPPRKDRPVLNLVSVVVGLIASGAVGFYLWSEVGRVGLDVNGAPILNASELLASSEVLLGETAAADGAALPADAACHFGATGLAEPTIVCGPVWLGRSAVDAPWLEMDLRFNRADAGVMGELLGVGGPVAADRGTFRRPDERTAGQPGAPVGPAALPRLRDGSRLHELDGILTEAESRVEAALAEQRASGASPVALADGWRCYLLQGPDKIWDSPVVDERAYCGPARTVQSGADEVWLRVLLRFEPGPSWGSVMLETAEVRDLRLFPIIEGANLARSDGASPPPIGLEEIDRPPVAPDTLAVVGYRLPVDSATTGTIATERDRLEFDGLARVDSVGAGVNSFTAPDGYDLVVASLAPNENRPSIRATVAIDGAVAELPALPAINDGGSIVLAVPESATTVDLVVENAGRPQTMSLLDGTLSPGFPLALYRPQVTPAAPFGARIEMPVGEAVVVTGTLERVTWRARDEDDRWLAEGLGHLLLEIAEWRVNQPCCDVTIESVNPTFSLVTSAAPASPEVDSSDAGPQSDAEPETDAEPQSDTEPQPDPEPTADQVADEVFPDRRVDPTNMSFSAPSPRFEVPEDVAEVIVRIEIVVTLTVDGQTETRTDVVEVELALP
jgi:hypothetical protein